MMSGWGNMMGGWGNGYGYGGYGGGYGWMGMMGLMMPIIFGVGIILLAIYVFRRNNSRVQTGEFGRHNSGLDILRERYARGEIDSAEYRSRKQDLEGK
ncbi:SHOCT domain-containing protein [Desulfosporosinus sp. Sb-LF]|uniref:SHOCT domain-containing protein n=1 Tax=Desulfosporosinus sp. Sb-LF TaxID=2560027 RepID=UPI00107F72D2|nr:SHOCT domain-containing protein [Desulfosporosinus sp. Sb-LF]TGE34353.1 SHOCT domain-containing protein [Desulfosporosinus sp. Sb-LF]